MYCIDYNAAEPIMLLNKQIGKTTTEDGAWDGVDYIDGGEFQKELLYLDSLGKRRIQVWINSPGGSIMEAMSIFSAILKSSTPVDTYNVGVAASSAGAVFMAARRMIMADYAQFMMHPVGGSTDDKALNAFKESCTMMLSGKAGMTAEMVGTLMDVTTWLGAADCFAKGICTEIEVTKDANKKYMPSADVKAMLAFSNNIITQTLTKPKTMTKVTNLLNLAEGSNEEVIVAAINRLTETANNAQEALTAAEQRAAELQEQLNSANAELETARAAAAAAEEEAATAAATEVVNGYKARIGDKPEAIAKWVNLAKADLEGTKALLEALPLNSAAPKPHEKQTAAPVHTAAGKMIEIANKHKQ